MMSIFNIDKFSMVKFSSIKIILFLLFFLTACSSEIDDFFRDENTISHLIAHSGNWQFEGYGSNSPEALESAMKKGFYASECDVRITKDTVFVICHDDDFHGMKISTTNYKALRGNAFDDEYLPTLDEFLNIVERLSQSPTKLILDLKYVDIRKLLDKINKRGLENKIEFFCTRSYLQSLIDLGYGGSTWVYDSSVSPEEAASLGVKGVSYQEKLIQSNPDIIFQIEALGLKAGVWTVNAKEKIKLYIEKGYYVTTDTPIH